MKVLYILMRNDLPSMNAGKAMAQASHASNAFIKRAGEHYKAHQTEVKEWQEETKQGFGTVLVLAANRREISEVIERCIPSFICEWVIDPSYPYRVESGEIAELISKHMDTIPRPEEFSLKEPLTLYRLENTCAYIFGEKEELEPYLSHLKLHP